MSKRIALFHATRAAVAPIETAFAEIWPDASHWSLLDEGLTQAVDVAGALTDDISERFIRLATYAADSDIDALLFTCTAFGPPMEECQRRFPFPTLKPNEALLETGLESGQNIGLLASHPVTLPMLEGQLNDLARENNRDIRIRPCLAEGAWNDLTAGRQEDHDRKVIESANDLAECDVVLLAQFSMAPLAAQIQPNVQGKVLSSPHAAVTKLKAMLEPA